LFVCFSYSASFSLIVFSWQSIEYFERDGERSEWIT
jgi:hypothetical protein